MKGIVISGHGYFAQGINSMIEGIIGRTEQLAIVPYSFDSSAAQLKTALERAVAEVDSGDGVIFLTDMLGGTPFNKSSEIAILNPRHHLLTGVNFTLIGAAISLREEIDDDDLLIDEILLAGKEAVTSFALKLNERVEVVTDGI